MFFMAKKMTEDEKQTRQLRLIHAQLSPGLLFLKPAIWLAVVLLVVGILASFAGIFKK
jgi:hypothetical protein